MGIAHRPNAHKRTTPIDQTHHALALKGQNITTMGIAHKKKHLASALKERNPPAVGIAHRPNAYKRTTPIDQTHHALALLGQNITTTGIAHKKKHLASALKERNPPAVGIAHRPNAYKRTAPIDQTHHALALKGQNITTMGNAHRKKHLASALKGRNPDSYRDPTTDITHQPFN